MRKFCMYRAMDVTLKCYAEKPIAKACIIVIDFGFALKYKNYTLIP
jgi:hypothetical protein